MAERTAARLHELLPELFTRNDRKVTPGGICTPENGCGPAGPTDLAKMLTGMRFTPPAPDATAPDPPPSPGVTRLSGREGEDPPR